MVSRVHNIDLKSSYLLTINPVLQALGRYGWATIRHSRGQTWPIATDWLQLVPGPGATRGEGGASVVSEDEEELVTDHATRAYLPSHLACIIHFLNEIKLVLYVGGHRKKLYNQTLENF